MARKPVGVSIVTEQLRAAARAGHLRYLGTDAPDGDLAVEVDGRQREYEPRQMLDWLSGFDLGRAAGQVQPVWRRRPNVIATVRAVLVNPSITDQARIRIRLVMQQEDVGPVELAKRIGVTTKSVTESLRWSAPGAIGMLAALGHDPAIRQDLADTDPDTPLTPWPPAGWQEPEMLARLRLLGYAHEQGVIAWVDPVDVNKASHAAAFTVMVGDTAADVRAEAVRPFLVGVGDAVLPDAADQMYGPPDTPK